VLTPALVALHTHTTKMTNTRSLTHHLIKTVFFFVNQHAPPLITSVLTSRVPPPCSTGEVEPAPCALLILCETHQKRDLNPSHTPFINNLTAANEICYIFVDGGATGRFCPLGGVYKQGPPNLAFYTLCLRLRPLICVNLIFYRSPPAPFKRKLKIPSSHNPPKHTTL
jgi:hypothetical protein